MISAHHSVTDRSSPGAWAWAWSDSRKLAGRSIKRGSASVCQPKMTPTLLLWLLVAGASLRPAGESLDPVTRSLGGGWLITKAAVSWDNKHWLSALWNTWAGVWWSAPTSSSAWWSWWECSGVVPLSGSGHISLTIRCLPTWLIQAVCWLTSCYST